MTQSGIRGSSASSSCSHSLQRLAPESWLVGDATRNGLGASLGATFGLAYFGDSIVAMGAGQLAQATAERGGPTMPFTVSTVFLALGAILAGCFWKENVGEAASKSAEVDASTSRRSHQ